MKLNRQQLNVKKKRMVVMKLNREPISSSIQVRTSLEAKLISQNNRREFNRNFHSAALRAFEKKANHPGKRDSTDVSQLKFCSDLVNARKSLDSKAKSVVEASSFHEVEGYSDLILKVAVELIAVRREDINPKRRGEIFLKAYLIVAAPGMKGPKGHNRKLLDCIFNQLLKLIDDLKVLAETAIKVISGLRQKEPSN